jgi:glycosyltransferase involved in cell wall biosynthesis
MERNLVVMIATAGRTDLLERTLTSLSACEKPMSYRKTIIVENGAKRGAEEVAAQFVEDLNICYRYVALGNKSSALNVGLGTIGDELIVFLDDDVRVDKDLLRYYAEAALEGGAGTFYGGPVEVDYELAPPVWLKQYLPLSAKGWAFGGEDDLTVPCFLGANWAAFADDLRRAGGFDPARGPGSVTGSTGQETAMQQRLLDCSIRAVYVSNARVWHYVPAERCSPHWAIERARRKGTERGIVAFQNGCPRLAYLRRLVRAYLKAPLQGFVSGLCMNEQRRFSATYWRCHDRAFLKGIAFARRQCKGGQ